MDPLQGPELVAVSQALLQVQEEIKRCESSIEAALLKVDAALEAREEWLRDFWREQLNHLRKKEEQLRKDKEQLRKEKELLLLERRLLLEREATSSLAPGTAKQEQIFHVIATIPRARRRKGVRGSVYKLAEVLLAMRPEDGSHCIWYDNDDLQIDLYFEFKQKAMEFETELDQWNFNNPFFQIKEAKVKPIQEVVEQRTLVRVRL
uniref:Uncharacterized protein n=2 Tax=Chrysotila carterae TaxID=13221 RepID=A0A6T0APN2_CHRCT